MIPRYDLKLADRFPAPGIWTMLPAEDGVWVMWQDIEHLLPDESRDA